MENETLSLLTPPPQERVQAWLAEIYGKPVQVAKRTLLRHRDLSYVERLWIIDAMPATLIYKVVLPPWDVEQDLHEHILIPSVSNSARLHLGGTYQNTTAMFMEDLGEQPFTESLKEHAELPTKVGTELAKMHRAYTYRIAEVQETNVLRCLLPADFASLAEEMAIELKNWSLVSDEQKQMLVTIGAAFAQKFADEPISLVHGDMYAENILYEREHIFFIDWSWFTKISTPILDLATLTMDHFKNGTLVDERDEVIEAYCAEYSRNEKETRAKLPFAELLSRLLFLEWLIERRRRGIMGTTVGPVEILIGTVLAEITMRFKELQKD